ncbi:MAG: response regulator [Pseudomonadota bacterium]
MKQARINTRIFLFLIIMSILLGIFLFAYSYFLSKKHVKSIFIEDKSKYCKQIARLIEPYLKTHNYFELSKIANHVFDENIMEYIAVFDNDGKLITLHPQKIQDKINSNLKHKNLNYFIELNDRITFYNIIKDRNENLWGNLQISYSANSIELVILNNLLPFLVALGCFIFIWVIYLTYYTKSIVRPLINFIDNLEAVSKKWPITHDKFRKDIFLPKSTKEVNVISCVLKNSLENIITLEKQAKKNEQLAAIGQTTAALAHDIRKPFTSIKSMLSMIDKYKEDPEFLSKAKSTVNQTIVHVEKMISDILDFSREVKVEVRPEAIVNIIDFAIRYTSQAFKDLSLKFDYRLESKFKPLCDDERMVRVFGNIIGNAIEAIGKKKNAIIWVYTKEIIKDDRTFVEITIGNNGPCFTDEDIPSLFKSFFTKGKKRGTGLGLASVQKIVLLHNGTIDARNVKDNNGVEFVICLPASKEIEYHKTHYLPQDINEILIAHYVPKEDDYDAKLNFLSKQKNIKVALLEDETLYRAFVRNTIKNNEILSNLISLYDVNNVNDCIKLIEKENVDFAIVDIDLNEEKNGYDFLKEVRVKNINLISMVHSNRYLDEEIQQAYDLGAKAYASKPLSIEQLSDFLFKSLNKDTSYDNKNIRTVKLEVDKPELSIFIADDNLIMRDYLHSILLKVLTPYKCHFYKFECPHEVLANFDKKKPDIVVSDNHYAASVELLGEDLLVKLRDKDNHVLLYLCSDLSEEELKEKCLKSKANGYFDPTVTTIKLKTLVIKQIEDYLDKKISRESDDNHAISKYLHDINKPILNTAIACKMMITEKSTKDKELMDKQLAEIKKVYTNSKDVFEKDKVLFKKHKKILGDDLKKHYEEQFQFIETIFEKPNSENFFVDNNLKETFEKVNAFLDKNKNLNTLIRKNIN